ncbi:MAG: hypothetical protein ABL955_01830 [Elusimicrobiota bacterium]
MTSMAPLAAVALSLVLCADAAFAKNVKKSKTTIAKGEGVTVTLKGDREVKGVYLGRHHNAVWVGVGGGEVGLDEAQVLKVAPSETPENEFLRRKAALAPNDVKGWWELCKFASENELVNYARSAAENVLAILPDHTEARAFFGQEKFNGVWMRSEHAQWQSGNVNVDGTWMPRKEAEEIWRLRSTTHRGQGPNSNQPYSSTGQATAPTNEDSSVKKISGYIERRGD